MAGVGSYNDLITANGLETGGNVNVTLLGGFTPTAGQAFRILNNSDAAGTTVSFAAVALGDYYVKYFAGTGNDVELVDADWILPRSAWFPWVPTGNTWTTAPTRAPPGGVPASTTAAGLPALPSSDTATATKPPSSASGRTPTTNTLRRISAVPLR